MSTRAGFAILLAVCSAPFVQGNIIRKGGITYFEYTGPSCPPLEATATSANAFLIRKKPGNWVCTLDFPPPQKTYLFVLGALSPGNYSILEQTELDPLPTPVLNFVVEADQERTITNYRLNAEGQVTFQIEGIGAIRYAIEKSLNLQTWTEIGHVTGLGEFTDLEADSNTSAFYRVRIVPD